MEFIEEEKESERERLREKDREWEKQVRKRKKKGENKIKNLDSIDLNIYNIDVKSAGGCILCEHFSIFLSFAIILPLSLSLISLCFSLSFHVYTVSYTHILKRVKHYIDVLWSLMSYLFVHPEAYF